MPTPYDTGIVKNYIRNWEPVKPVVDPNGLTITSPLSHTQTTTLFADGLGKSVQSVVRQGSLVTGGTAKDMVDAFVYDAYDRQVHRYLPFAANTTGDNTSVSDGLFKFNPFQQDSFFSKGQYPGEAWFYRQTNFENSPLNRPLEVFAAGSSWVGTSGEILETDRRSVKAKYWYNTVTDSVRVWGVTDISDNWGSYSSSSFYAADMLSKLIMVDEHGRQSIEFKDKKGRLLLKKVQLTASADTGNGSGYTGWLCTYYLYDYMNRLRCVVQPRGVELLRSNSWNTTALSNAILDEQCFRFEYNGRGNMIMKKVPGAGAVYMVYDARDRLVLTQDANLRGGSPVQWLYTQYDELNRPIASGLWNNSSSLSTHATAAASSSAYPNLSGQTYEELTRTFYDDYSWRSSYSNPLSATYNTSYDTYFLTASNSSWPYAQGNSQSAQIKGLVTGTRVKVLGSGSTYLYTVNFYDSKNRVIQVQSSNITGGTDIATTQYSWHGQPLTAILKQEKSGTNAQTIVAVSKLTYDSLWRVVKTEKKVSHSQVNSGNMPGSWTTIAENEYDALGQLKRKKLAPAFNGGAGLDSLTYDYNIRGWALGMNRLYAKDVHQDNYFGFDLGYDKAQNGIINNQSYSTPQYNGNISGMVWKSKGDADKRKYDFTYDAANRILSADFNQYSGSSFDKSAGIDFSMSGMGYDANGNILSMKQRGFKVGGSTTIDSLQYNYVSYSNKLLNVIDGANDTLTRLGDFRTSSLHPGSGSKNNTTIDYSYDANGNLVKDLNKDLVTNAGANGIEYNHLNLPQKINVKKRGGDKGYIEYTYDASGTKLRKTVYEPGVDTIVTLYMAGVSFRNDTLEFISHEEGRIRKKGMAALVYDYALKDHLGNLRVLLTTERDTAFYPAATHETTNLVTERIYYGGVDTGRVATNTYANYPSNGWQNGPSDYFQKLNGNGPSVGSNMVLKVMAGDQVNLYVNYWYEEIPRPGPGSPVSPFSSVLNALLSGVGGITTTHGGATTTQIQNSNVLDPTVTSFLSGQSGYVNTRPKAFLSWILLDEQLRYVASNSGFSQVEDIESGNGSKIMVNNHTLTKNGYLYIYVSNESPNVDVFFDNLQVTHIRGPLLEETHYYPFGLTMAGISSKALAYGGIGNRYKFNNRNEFQSNDFSSGGSLEMYDAVNRMYDPQIGRFWQIDELAESNWWESPYSFAHNSPIGFNDPLGLDPETSTPDMPKVLPEVVVFAIPKGLWAKQRLYYLIRDQLENQNATIDQILQPDLRDMMYRFDGITQHRRRVAKMTKESDIAFLEAASWFAPTAWIGNVRFLRYGARLFRWKRGGTAAKITTEVTEGVVKHGDEAVKVGEQTVYVSVQKGVTKYVGITNDLARRAAEHLAQKGIRINPLMTGLSKADARAVEQALIEIHGLAKNGGTLINKINSIAASNPSYSAQLQRGLELLQSIGY